MFVGTHLVLVILGLLVEVFLHLVGVQGVADVVKAEVDVPLEPVAAFHTGFVAVVLVFDTHSLAYFESGGVVALGQGVTGLASVLLDRYEFLGYYGKQFAAVGLVFEQV